MAARATIPMKSIGQNIQRNDILALRMDTSLVFEDVIRVVRNRECPPNAEAVRRRLQQSIQTRPPAAQADG